jgi:hypothetical protein
MQEAKAEARKGAHTCCMQPFAQRSWTSWIGVPKWVVIVERALRTNKEAFKPQFRYDSFICAPDILVLNIAVAGYNARHSSLRPHRQ